MRTVHDDRGGGALFTEAVRRPILERCGRSVRGGAAMADEASGPARVSLGRRWAPVLVPIGLLVAIALALRSCDGATRTDHERLGALEATALVSDPPAPLTLIAVRSDVGSAVFQNRTRSIVMITFDTHGLSQPQAASRLAAGLIDDGWSVGRADCVDGDLDVGAGKDLGEFYGVAQVSGRDEGEISVVLYAPGADDAAYPQWWTGALGPSVPVPPTCQP